MKDAKLTPRIEQTAKLLWAVYAGLTVACIVCLKGAGMNWFDAVCHGFSALSLGGFSTYDASIGHFNSLRIELVLIVFQVLAALNFATHFLGLEPARGARLFPGRRGEGDFRRARGELRGHRDIPLHEEHLRGFPDGAAPRDVQRRVHRHRFADCTRTIIPTGRSSRPCG